MTFSICGCLGQACGRAPLNSRIVGGQNAPTGAWPWLASLHVSGVPTCGGSLINSQWVLAAAQCFPSVSASNVVVYVGRQIESVSASNPNEESRTVSQIIVHENYDFFTGENDIALLQLSSSVTFTDHIQPVCLAATGSVFSNGTVSWVAGWGVTAEGGSPPSSGALQEIQVAVIENSQCDSLYGGGFVTDNMICAGLLSGGKDACQGDTGGPLVSKQDSVWVQSGIVGMPGCARPNQPTIYTRISEYQDWINSRVGADQPGFVEFTSSGAGGASTTTTLAPTMTQITTPAPTSTHTTIQTQITTPAPTAPALTAPPATNQSTTTTRQTPSTPAATAPPSTNQPTPSTPSTGLTSNLPTSSSSTQGPNSKPALSTEGIGYVSSALLGPWTLIANSTNYDKTVKKSIVLSIMH
ncbi:serine protease 33-like isoform X2 [Engraulis encrasicolus]|uniref:serine protease 33-like isoform X2 n=1 Tax=Engraulis encrasicolus TaxID=184585 RepID=UPI002FD567A6